MSRPAPTIETAERIVSITITYTTTDRFELADEGSLSTYTQNVSGRIEGLLDDYETTVPLGALSLSRIDAWAAAEDLFDVLDESSEWNSYITAVDEDAQYVLIMDRCEIEPWARGRGIGLTALARAIRTWGDDAQVLMIASPPGAKGEEAETGRRALATYWARLGVQQIEGSDPPILTGATGLHEFDEALKSLTAWPHS